MHLRRKGSGRFFSELLVTTTIGFRPSAMGASRPADLEVAELGDPKRHLLDLAQQVVRKIARRLVDFIDQHHRPRGGRMGHRRLHRHRHALDVQRAKHRAAERVVGDERSVVVAAAARLEPANRVEGVEQVAGRARGLGVVPLHVGAADVQQLPRRELPRDTERQLRLPRSGIPGHEQRLGEDATPR